MSLKEKFQITVRPAPDEDDGNEWVWAADLVNKNKPKKSTIDDTHVTGEVFSNTSMAGQFLNHTPPGMDISNQCNFTQGQMPLSVAGSTDVSGVQASLEFQSTKSRGTAIHNMGMTDDQYNGEHIDLFYGTAYGTDGDPDGFVERNNYLDRL